MKNITVSISIIAIIALSSIAFARGGDGATCTPVTANWSSCALAPVPFQASITGTVNIPSGHYAAPYQANQTNTEYVLQGDITADGTAITVGASYVIINLNGHTITYNQSTPGEGVTVGNVWNKHHVAIRNGSIIQGTALSEGDQYGSFNNPVSTCNTQNAGCRSVNDSHISNLYVRYGGRDVGGFKWTGGNIIVEQNTVEDTYEFGTFKNRHQGVDGILGGLYSTIRNNTLINSRHRGITIDNYSTVYGNHITTRTIATNGNGISGYKTVGAVVHSNTIIARGEHPIGIGFGSDGAADIEVYNNYIDAKTTALGEEYGAAYLANPTSIITGNFAVGFRTSWGAHNLNVHDNEFHVSSDSNYTGTYSPTGAVAYINTGARGIWAGTIAGQTATFSNNIVTVSDKDGTGKAYGLACNYNFSDQLYFLGNIVTSNITNVAIGDDYGQCGDFPLFQGNTFLKAGNYAAYKTLTNQLGGYFSSEARLVDNIYQNGASIDSIDFHPSGGGVVNIYFGSIDNDQYKYSYRLHDNNGASATLLREDFMPATTLGYRYPVALPVNSIPVIERIILK